MDSGFPFPPVMSHPSTLRDASKSVCPHFMMQGRYFTVTLHALSLCVIGLYGSDLSGDEMDRLTASYNGHLKTIWEANCSCRSAGYLMEPSEAQAQVSTCSGLPSLMDVPTMSQAAARESAAEILRSLRQLAGRVRPDPSAGGGDSNISSDPTSPAGWAELQAELLAPTPSEGAEASSPCSWGEALWCFNPACTNLEGPSELSLKTFACGGGCGVRYCSPVCQAQGWRDGHRLSCGRLRDRRVIGVVGEGEQHGVGEAGTG